MEYVEAPEEQQEYEEIIELVPVAEGSTLEANPTEAQGKPRSIYTYYFQ